MGKRWKMTIRRRSRKEGNGEEARKEEEWKRMGKRRKMTIRRRSRKGNEEEAGKEEGWKK
jgi:hypothetical protein